MSRPAASIQPEIQRLEVSEAQRRIWDDCPALTAHQQITVREALHRVLAEPVHSPINVPAHTNSAVDGFAVHHDDIPGEGRRQLTVIGTARAGEPFQGSVERGQAVRIMTGAVMPAGTDTSLMQEQVNVTGSRIDIGHAHRKGENVRLAGEDLSAGGVALAAGKRLQAADLGMLASLGINELKVFRRPRVAFFSTGDELRSLGEPLQTGQIYDSNRYTLLGMLKAAHVEVFDLGIVKDEPTALRHTLQEAAREADAIITSGGVSVGDADYIREVMQDVGRMNFWQIAMKPGRPLAYGRVQDTPLFGLPGNPVAVMVTFYQFVRPALSKLSGISDVIAPATFRVKTADAFRKKPGRTEYQRAILKRDDNGELWVHSFGRQGSGILRSMSEANCLVVLPSQGGNVEIGDMVDVQPFEGLLS